MLAIDGTGYAGWTEARIVRSYLQFCPSFDLSYINKEIDPRSILPGMRCELFYGSHKLITGYVNQAQFDEDGSTYRASASGRALTQDLVDCSATHPIGHWKNRTLTQIAAD